MANHRSRGVVLPFGPERLAQLVEALPVGVFILDANGTAVYQNTAAHALLGRQITAEDRADNLGVRFPTFVSGTDDLYPNEQLPIVRALKGQRTTVDDMDIVVDGIRTALEVTATPIFDDDGNVIYAVAVFQDITARKHHQQELERLVNERTSELERASRAKSVFLMNVSHELRTPLNHIIGFSELLAERTEDARSRKLATIAETSGRDLLEKINDLIELARAEAEPGGGECTPFDFDHLLHRVTGGACALDEPVGTIRGDCETFERVLRYVVRAAGDDLAITARVDGGRLVLAIESERLSHRVRALTHLLGEQPLPEDARFQQQEVDIRLAVARAQARTIGGDIHAHREDGREVVRVVLPTRVTPT